MATRGRKAGVSPQAKGVEPKVVRKRVIPTPKSQKPEGVAQRKRLFLEAYEQAMCNVSIAAKNSGISYRTPYNWRDTDPEFRQAMDSMQELRIDFVENALDKSIRNGNVSAQIFFLKCKAKHRGYVERQEITGAEGGPISVMRGEMTDSALQSALAKVLGDDPDLVAKVATRRG